MDDLMNRRVKQMHAALGGLQSDNLLAIKPVIQRGFDHVHVNVDFSQGSDEIELANAAQLVTANIASLKDHLAVWCEQNGKQFLGDQLINTNKAVALVHDLWNVDKHAVLSRPPRSGIRPCLRNVGTVLNLSTGREVGAVAFFSIDPLTGAITHGTEGSGRVSLRLVADVLDEHGNFVAHFNDI